MDLQTLINAKSSNGKLDLLPGEYFGQVTIDRPMTIVGKGTSTWIGSKKSPAIRITVPGVRLQNLMVELTEDPHGSAIQAEAGCDPVLEDVIVRGLLPGVCDTRISTENSHQLESSVQIVFAPPPPISPVSLEESVQISSDSMRGPTRNLSRVDVKIEALFARAAQAENRQDWNTVIESYQDILTLCPGHADAKSLLRLARVKVTKGAGARKRDLQTTMFTQGKNEWQDDEIDIDETALFTVCNDTAIKAEESVSQRQRKSGPGKETADPHLNGKLVRACWGGNKKEVEWLLAHGANPNAAGGLFGASALMNACATGHTEIVKLLLWWQADPNATDTRGMTALMKAASKGRTEIVRLLLAHGADPNMQTKQNETALGFAANVEIRELFMEKSAKST